MKQYMTKKWPVLLLMLFLAFCLIVVYRVGHNWREAENGFKSGETSYSFAMGTSVSVSLYGAGQNEYAAVEQQVEELDRIISWREHDGELYKLNHEYEENKPYALSDVLYVALRQAYRICNDSDGALDITIRPLASVWNIENATKDNFRVPDDEEIKTALKKVGYESIKFGEDQAVTILKPGMILDLGSVGKGFALDVVKQKLKEDGVKGATVSVGGSILVYGEKEDGSAFRVGIRNPDGHMEDWIGYLEIPPQSNLCISTSGDYEKYFEVDGVRYHHILDRKTGYPAQSGLASVTVVCENGLNSDALSTACFVLGYEDSLALLKKYNAEAIFIDQDNRIAVTDGLKDLFFEK